MQVPLKRQSDPAGCGPASLAMLLRYVGRDVTESVILEGTGGVSVVTRSGLEGTMVVDNALYAAQSGLDVQVHTYNMNIFTEDVDYFLGFPPEDIEEYLIGESFTGVDDRIARTYIALIEAGADLKVKRPDIGGLIGFLKQEIPVMVNVTQRILYGNDAHPDSGHSIVVTGYRNGVFSINDPDLGRIRVGEKVLFQAWYNYATTHSAHLIAVRAS